MARIRSDRTGYTYACPACDRTTIYEREGRGNTSDYPDRPYRCEDCGVVLQYIIERPKKRLAVSGQTALPGIGERRDTILSRELAAKAPEDLGLSPIGVRGGQP